MTGVWYNPLSWWDSTTPVEQAVANHIVGPTPVETDWLSGLGDLVSKVGGIFDAGYSIYSRITGRIKADNAIDDETEGRSAFTIGHTIDLNAFYAQNTTLIWVFGIGIVLIGAGIIGSKIVKKRS